MGTNDKFSKKKITPNSLEIKQISSVHLAYSNEHVFRRDYEINNKIIPIYKEKIIIETCTPKINEFEFGEPVTMYYFDNKEYSSIVKLIDAINSKIKA